MPEEMHLTFIFSFIVQIILASSLWFVWSRNRSEAYAKYLGNAYMANAFYPVFYIPYNSPSLPLQVAGIAGMTLAFFFYLFSMIDMLIAISGRRIKTSVRYTIIVIFIMAAAVALANNSPRYAQLVLTTFAVSIGIITTMWLWRQGGLQRLIGPFIFAGTLTGLMFIIYGDQVLQLQLYILIIIRVLLAMTVIYISIQRAETERKRLLEQLHHSQKLEAIGQLAGGVAHDFNNMLGGIIGAAELLKMDPADVDNRPEYLDIIINTSKRAADLTQKLLSFARKGKNVSLPVDVAEIISDTASILRRTVDKKVSITVENCAAESVVSGDPSQLQNAFLNMGINSSYAMPEGGTLSFRLENRDLDQDYCRLSSFNIKPGPYVEIEVRDNGCGMTMDVQKRIFEPFFTTRKDGEGTGLGLASVYGTVQEHMGAITVYSEEGAGTVFHIYLPLGGDTVYVQAKAAQVIKGSGVILLVDDEEIIRITGRAMLNSLGYDVLLAVNGMEAADIFRKNHERIDLVILDMIMPVMSGRDAYEEIRRIDPSCRILISSGFSKEGDLAKIEKNGYTGFIRKPFRQSELSSEVARLLGK